MTVVVTDASVVVAALAGRGEHGDLAAARLSAGDLAAPHLLPVEVANVLRRAVAAGQLDEATAARAHEGLMQLRVDLFPYELVGRRVWQLRANLTAYDATYVAVAELLGASLLTLDRRLARSPGPWCPIDVLE